MKQSTITLPSSLGPGFYSFKVFCAQNRCEQSTTFVIPGQGTSEFSWQVPSQEANWDGFNPTVIGMGVQIGNYFRRETSQLVLEVRAGFGCLNQLYDKVTGRYLINSPDQGRGDGKSSYTGPRSFSDDAPHWRTGYNPLKDGDAGLNPSPVLFKGQVTINGIEYIYTRTQLLSWSHVDARRMPVIYEEWRGFLDDTKLDIWTRLTHDRADTTDYGPYQQEWGLMMVNGRGPAHFYNGDAPFTYGGTQITDGIESQGNDGSYLVCERAYPVSEPWVGVEIGPNRLLAQYNRQDLFFQNSHVLNPQNGDFTDGGMQCIYTCGHPLANFDAKGVWTFHDVWIVGTEREIRDYVYAQPHDTRPDYVFNGINQRNGWVGWDGVTDQQMPFAPGEVWKTRWLGKTDNGVTSADNSKLRSPYTAFKASEVPTIYIKGRYRGAPTKMALQWRMVGQESEGLNNSFPGQNSIRFPKGLRDANQVKLFDVIGDGEERTYAIQPGWSGIISQFEIAQNRTGAIIAPGQEWDISYIGYRNPDA